VHLVGLYCVSWALIPMGFTSQSYYGLGMIYQLWCFYVFFGGVWIVIGVGANMVINNSAILRLANLDCLHMFKKILNILHKILNDFGYFTFILFVPNLPKCCDDIYY